MNDILLGKIFKEKYIGKGFTMSWWNKQNTIQFPSPRNSKRWYTKANTPGSNLGCVCRSKAIGDEIPFVLKYDLKKEERHEILYA